MRGAAERSGRHSDRQYDATQFNRLVAMLAVFVVLLLASSVGGQDRSADVVVGKSTKADILARFGRPREEGRTDRVLWYHATELGPPPYPPSLEIFALRSNKNFMVLFKFDERGVLLEFYETTLPSP